MPKLPDADNPAQRVAQVIDLARARARLRPTIQTRQDIVGALVGQLAALARGTTTAERAGEVRRAATLALDLFEDAERGRVKGRELGEALASVERLLEDQRH
ncbi:MAG: hypothetical protein ACYCWW_13075 [Deltaproteobacteria bacterium]